MTIELLQKIREGLYRDMKATGLIVGQGDVAALQVEVSGIISYLNSLELRGDKFALVNLALIVGCLDGLIAQKKLRAPDG